VRNLSFTPPVTVLKPLKGADANTRRCLQSWLDQDYPAPVQILFGVASPDDPVCALVNQLLAENPKCDARLVICRESLGVNAKVSSLIQLHRLSQNEIIVVSDADVFVPTDFLRNAVAPLDDTSVGLVNCFYRLANPSTFPMRWEAIGTNADFWSQVLQGQSLAPLDFALGAVMTMRRNALEKIGGFEALADYLADDFQLGNRLVHMTGLSIAICPVVVDCFDAPIGWAQAWAHQLRWARTIRVSKPLPYFFSILSNATLWPLLWVALAPSALSMSALAFCLFIRIANAQTLQMRLGQVPRQNWFFWLVPIKDLLQFALWLAAFTGNRILWRGQLYRLQRNGRLIRV
ncbi:MAG TPA: glycosyltransferase, partial [Candidatus Cybelea sp.]|nr:glycosyltransferase [Candidatus Cybelea sp.]